MKRRNTERQDHQLVHQFMELCNMYDLQGLLMDENDNFTAAVECFTYDTSENPKNARESTFTEIHWLAVLTLAEVLGVPFHLFLHRNESKEIMHYDISKDRFINNESINVDKMTEDMFISWWCSHKKTNQRKDYREDMSARIKDSYFDRLLEENNLKWGGNIDAFVASEMDDFRPLAIVENRVTTKKSLAKYDPAQYYGADINTWKPLFLVCSKLCIPLILCTYSVFEENEKNLIGIAEVDIEQTDKLVYRGNPPYKQYFTNMNQAKAFLMSIIKNAVQK